MTRIDHIGIWTHDLEKVKEFYVKYFGCVVNEKYVNPTKQFESYFLSFKSGARIELMKRTGKMESRSDHSAGLAHISIAVGSREEVDKLTKRLEMEGVIIESRPRITGDGYYESSILDPENNRIEIIA